jgi:hypothetical protein
MTAEEKQIYQNRAALDRERVAKELEAWKAAAESNDTSVAPINTSKWSSSVAAAAEAGCILEGHPSPASIIYPVAKIRKICKLDPDVRGLSKEATLLITKAAELMTIRLGLECVRVAQIQNRRKLLPDDVAQVCSTREQFLFLREDIQDLARQETREAKSNKQNTKKSSSALDKAVPGTKSLTAYFGSKK